MKKRWQIRENINCECYRFDHEIPPTMIVKMGFTNQEEAEVWKEKLIMEVNRYCKSIGYPIDDDCLYVEEYMET